MNRTPRWPRAFSAAALLALATVPTLAIVQQAFAQDAEEAPEEAKHPTKAERQQEKRRAVLRAMVGDETALINLTARDMPASPDILNVGRKGTRALARCVSDNVDDGQRMRCAGLLGQIGDRSALKALHSALEAWNADVRAAAIGALAKIPDPSSIGPLERILEREDEEAGNRGAALAALGAISDPRVLKRARALLLQSKPADGALRAIAFEAMWRNRHLMARTTVLQDVAFGLRQKDDQQVVLAATFAAGELRAPQLREPLVRLMAHPNARIRNRAVYAIGKIGDKAATAALLGYVPKVRESRMLNNISFALERLDPKAFYTTANGLIGHTQAQIRMNTAFVLGDVRRKEGLPLLRSALDDKNDTVKLSAVRALGKLDAPDAAALLERYVDDARPSLKHAAIYAIFALSGMKRTDLVRDKLYVAKDATVKLEAALALGRAGDARVLPDLLACLEADSCEQEDVSPLLASRNSPEVAGRTLVAWTKGRADLTELVAQLRPTGAGVIAISDAQAALARGDLRRARVALDLAGDVAEKSALQVLEPLLSHEDAGLRLHAAVALSRAGQQRADAVLFADLDNLPVAELPRFVRALRRIDGPARTRLLPELQKREKSADVPVAVAAAAVHLAWDADAAVFLLLEALAAPTRQARSLAERYLRADERPLVTSLLRRALAREQRDFVRDQLRRILDLRAEHDDGA